MASSGGVLAVVATYTYTYIYCFELSTETLTIQRFVTIPGILVALPLAAWLTRMLDKKMTVVYTCIVCATLIGLPQALRMIGFFPRNDSAWMVPMLFGCMLLGFLGLPVVPIVIDSQLVDVADEYEIQHRAARRRGGFRHSCLCHQGDGRHRRPARAASACRSSVFPTTRPPKR